MGGLVNEKLDKQNCDFFGGRGWNIAGQSVVVWQLVGNAEFLTKSKTP